MHWFFALFNHSLLKLTWQYNDFALIRAFVCNVFDLELRKDNWKMLSRKKVLEICTDQNRPTSNSQCFCSAPVTKGEKSEMPYSFYLCSSESVMLCIAKYITNHIGQLTASCYSVDQRRGKISEQRGANFFNRAAGRCLPACLPRRKKALTLRKQSRSCVPPFFPPLH